MESSDAQSPFFQMQTATTVAMARTPITQERGPSCQSPASDRKQCECTETRPLSSFDARQSHAFLSINAPATPLPRSYDQSGEAVRSTNTHRQHLHRQSLKIVLHHDCCAVAHFQGDLPSIL